MPIARDAQSHDTAATCACGARFAMPARSRRRGSALLRLQRACLSARPNADAPIMVQSVSTRHRAPYARGRRTRRFRMRVIIPVESEQGLAAPRSGHFGHAAYFTIATIENGEVTSVETIKNVDHDQFGCGGVIDFALSQNVDAIIATGMGMPPYSRFTAAGVAVYAERETPLAGDVLAKFLAGEVALMDPNAACRH
ncbi:NifB/NifX family molybdenum-iron cluster-binding protein [Collinsella tanakaei]|uniref:NifB/NifX family molybdenum-iron cluster-binding protein n=1 Tax=Collinsella tanakaei TaxID=626935 RepID=UPI00338D5244